MKLEFKEIQGFSGYRVNTLGQVWSDRSNRIRKSFVNKGYQQLGLVNDEGKIKTRQVHQLVAIAFLNHKPNGLNIVVDHIDGNPLNNRLDNLQIVSNRKNTSKDRCRTKKSGLPLNISCVDNRSYSFQYYYRSKTFTWGLPTLEQAIEMKEVFEYLVEVDGEEYALKTLDENRRSAGRKFKAEISGDIIVIK